MEPLTALSLACNVTQLVEQAVKVADACKEIYNQGSLDTNNEIDKYADGISIANKELQTLLRNTTSGSTPRITRLGRIAKDASETAEELRLELNKLKLAKSQGLRHLGGTFKTTLKSVMKKGTIEKLRKKLECQDTALGSGILKDL